MQSRESVNVISAVAVINPSNEGIQNRDIALSLGHVSLELFLIVWLLTTHRLHPLLDLIGISTLCCISFVTTWTSNGRERDETLGLKDYM